MKFTLSHEYMSESYDQARKYGSKWLVFERIIGVIFVLLGIGLYISTNGETAISIALIAIGIFELFSNNLKKYFWLRRYAKSKLMNAEIEFEITDAGIESTSPYSYGRCEWNGIEKIVRTPKGILVWPQKGVYWYLPERIAGEQAIALIQSKVV